MLRSTVCQLSKRSFVSTGARSYFAKAQFIGRVGADVEEVESASGRRYARYPIAVQVTKDSPTSWFNIVCFSEKQLDFMTEYVKKGCLVHVDAAINQETYEKDDGTKKESISFVQSEYL